MKSGCDFSQTIKASKSLLNPNFLLFTCLIFFPIVARIQQLKHAVPKGDKKKKKEVTSEIAVLEAELEARHEKELLTFAKSCVGIYSCLYHCQNIFYRKTEGSE